MQIRIWIIIITIIGVNWRNASMAKQVNMFISGRLLEFKKGLLHFLERDFLIFLIFVVFSINLQLASGLIRRL